MAFSERAKLTALAIVKIFETSRPFGDYSAVAVLDDGAGVSYGTSQFTHRSGSLRAVLVRFHKICEETGVQPLLVGYEDLLADQSPRNILKLSQDQRFKNGLQAAGEREAMRQAQREIAYEMYLKPALDACEGSDFECPLSLAVIYDSINHGSFKAIRDRVLFQGPGNGSIKPEEFEREWIFRYVKARHAWLNSKPRLVKTAYRTKFFLEQIARNNWNLDFPMTVHGYRLTEKDIPTNHIEDLREDEVDLEVTNIPSSSSEEVIGEASPEIFTPAPEQPLAPTPEFVAQDKVVDAPPKENSTENAAKVTVGGFAVPTFIVAIFTAIKGWIADGYVDAKEVGNAVISFISNNQKFVFAGLGLIIGGWMLKKLYRQITLWLQMYFAARPDMNNVTVKPQ